MHFNLSEHTHKRLNILTGEWVIVSPHRNRRPWQGKQENKAVFNTNNYDNDCYLCPENKRADCVINPNYQGPFVFTNDFAALIADTPDANCNVGDLLQMTSQKGICRVVCFSPKHNLTLSQMSIQEIEAVILIWRNEFMKLAANEWIKYIQIFENKGEIMGCSNPHPHGQIWALNDLPNEIVKETGQQKTYFQQKGSSLLYDYVVLELSRDERIVYTNNSFVALVPFWAVWPFEIIIVSKRHVQNITQFTNEENTCLAEIIKVITTKYDQLFDSPFPYSAGMHQAPVNNGNHEEWHWHLHFYPPLLRSATIKKFMVGFELLANPQRDTTPELAAAKLRELIT